jgi:hypothetical protein
MRRAWVLLPFLLLACGDDDDSPAIDAAPPDAPLPLEGVALAESFCEDQAELFCAALETCSCRFDLRDYDAAGCVAAEKAACVENLLTDTVRAEIEAGTTVVGAGAVANCLARASEVYEACRSPQPFDQVVCFAVLQSSTDEWDRPCEGSAVFCNGGHGICLGEGTRRCTQFPADECLEGLCRPGSVCHGEEGCGPPRGIDEPCPVGLDSECQTGLVCGSEQTCVSPGAATSACLEVADCSTGLTCVENACAPATALGEACSGAQCGQGRGCGRAPESRTCGTPDAVGEMCMVDTCGEGLGCADDSMMCETLPTSGECLNGSECAAGFGCLDGGGGCAPLPGEGETCLAGQVFCAEGLGCDFTDNTCRPGPGIGQACLNNGGTYVCAAGLGCDFTAEGSFCAEKRGAGGACMNDFVCGEGTYCEFSLNQCAPRLADGMPCEDGNECLVGSECAWQPGNTYACQPLPASGESCAFDCTAGLTCQGPGGECVAEICGVY